MGLPKIDKTLYYYTMLSTGKKIAYVPFTAKEQKILLMAKEAKDTPDERTSIINAITQIMENCTLGKVDIKKMATFDFEKLFLEIRSKSVGELIPIKYRYNYESEDGKPLTQFIDITININDIKIEVNPEHEKTIKITDDIGMVMKYPTFDLVYKVENEFDVVMSCIDYIYDKDEIFNPAEYSKEELEEFYDSLEMGPLLKLKNFYDTLPKLRHEVELVLIDGTKETVVFEGLESFFI